MNMKCSVHERSKITTEGKTTYCEECRSSWVENNWGTNLVAAPQPPVASGKSKIVSEKPTTKKAK